jgi:6-phosphofructokinase 1
MGRHSGFIACYASLAMSDANFVLIPEVPFQLEGDNGLLAVLRRRLEARGHAVIVVAEGAGQELMDSPAPGPMPREQKADRRRPLAARQDHRATSNRSASS